MLHHSSLLEDGWEEEAQQMRVYFMLTLLFGAKPESQSIQRGGGRGGGGEGRGRLALLQKKTESFCQGNLL